ncbi:MAG: hypothetical protein HYX94_13670 [Chloroflexi bacterium]|nr:hypothetical protein [Chloroflexota bacterium]
MVAGEGEIAGRTVDLETDGEAGGVGESFGWAWAAVVAVGVSSPLVGAPGPADEVDESKTWPTALKRSGRSDPAAIAAKTTRQISTTQRKTKRFLRIPLPAPEVAGRRRETAIRPRYSITFRRRSPVWAEKEVGFTSFPLLLLANP